MVHECKMPQVTSKNTQNTVFASPAGESIFGKKIIVMKTKFFFRLLPLLATILFLTTACRSSSDDPQTPQPQNSGFFWHENSPGADMKTAGSSEVRTQYNSIFAFNGATATSGTVFEINLTAVTPGTYTIGGGNSFYFNGNTATPSGGQVIITSNAGGKASGSFTATWTSGTITSVYGTFTDIPVN